MLESDIDAPTEAMDGAARIALLEGELEQLRRRDAEREAELAMRERRIQMIQHGASAAGGRSPKRIPCNFSCLQESHSAFRPSGPRDKRVDS